MQMFTHNDKYRKFFLQSFYFLTVLDIGLHVTCLSLLFAPQCGNYEGAEMRIHFYTTGLVWENTSYSLFLHSSADYTQHRGCARRFHLLRMEELWIVRPSSQFVNPNFVDSI